ncbi:MAG: hypothetical protein E6713_13280 [Sporomusaceae bacterium]|nr:hypothetical protein [Sporomusaceae bacterium]
MHQEDTESFTVNNHPAKKSKNNSTNKNKISASEKTQIEAVNALASHVNKAECET